MPEQIPLHTYFEGDAFCTVVLAEKEQTIKEFAASVEALVVGRRVRNRGNAALKVTYNGRGLSPDVRVGEAGVRPFERVDVGYE